MRKQGTFIVLEGPDKSGKSTQANLLARDLRSRGFKVVHTREPGGTSFAEAIRKIILDPRGRVHPIAELLLYEASRAQHTQELLIPALRSGAVVVCERYTMATLAYQGGARGLPPSMIRRLNAIATGGLVPHLTLVLDMPGHEFDRRDRRRRHDRLEKESASFRRKVRLAYRRLARTEPGAHLIDATLDQDLVREKIFRLVSRILIRHSRGRFSSSPRRRGPRPSKKLDSRLQTAGMTIERIGLRRGDARRNVR